MVKLNRDTITVKELQDNPIAIKCATFEAAEDLFNFCKDVLERGCEVERWYMEEENTMFDLCTLKNGFEYCNEDYYRECHGDMWFYEWEIVKHEETEAKLTVSPFVANQYKIVLDSTNNTLSGMLDVYTCSNLFDELINKCKQSEVEIKLDNNKITFTKNNKSVTTKVY